MQQIVIWQNGSLQFSCSPDQIHDALEDDEAIIWLDIQFDGTLQKYEALLNKEFRLLPLVIDMIQEDKERAKLIGHGHYFYLVVHSLIFNAASIETTTPKLDIVFGKNFLITAHQTALPWLDDLHETIHAEETKDSFIRQGTSYLLHVLMDNLVDSYFPVLDDIDSLVDDLEDATVQQATNEVQARIFRMKRVLAQMRRVISPQVEVSNSLITRTGDFIPAEVEPYFADVHDHLIRTFEILDSYRDLMSSLLDVYLTTVSNRQNEIMKQLALISTIFLPITFITGIFGQNFGQSPQITFDKGYNFWIVLCVMVIISFAQIWYFRYRKWIK